MEGFSVFTAIRTKHGFIINRMESQEVTNISDYRDVVMYNENEVQVFPKLLKQLQELQYTITHK